MKNAIAVFLLASLAGASCAFGAGTVSQYSQETPADYRQSAVRFGNLPGGMFGPRIAWAEPFVLGKLKLLIVLPNEAAREAVELQSRIPAEVSLIATATHDQWNWPPAAYEAVPITEKIAMDTAHRLLSAGYHYDAIIIGKVQWSSIPAEIRLKILEKARAPGRFWCS